MGLVDSDDCEECEQAEVLLDNLMQQEELNVCKWICILYYNIILVE